MINALTLIVVAIAVAIGAALLSGSGQRSDGMRMVRVAGPVMDLGTFTPYDIAPVPVKQVRPDYPTRALYAELEGTVYLKVWVTAEGRVKQTVVQHSDNHVFDEAAQIAAMKWEFTPALSKNRPVDAWVPVPIRFTLKKV
ncbi:MAG: energy transducer TonB [Ignavibacteria bacterium]|nr:energy transducer TonB [Ignavibacteria bacterium]